MNYLQIVNDAMAECKVSLDPLTSVNFASPPRTALYDHFKRWANDVYRELMIERPQWFFRKERTVIQLWPRLHLSGLSYTPAPGDVMRGQESGTQFTVVAVRNYEDNEESTVVERTVDVEFDDSSDPRNFAPNEPLDLISPVPATDVGFVAFSGRYNFADELQGFSELDINSVNTYYNDSNVGERLVPVLWKNWVNRFNYHPYGGVSSPGYITRAPDGNYELFPQPIEPFFLGFDYTRDFPDMVDYDDTPVGVPEDYQQILVWLTVAEYADWDSNTRVYARAAKKLRMYDYFLFRDEIPEVGFGRSRFDFPQGY